MRKPVSIQCRNDSGNITRNTVVYHGPVKHCAQELHHSSDALDQKGGSGALGISWYTCVFL